MIIDSGKYFIYRHIRLDKLTPFYIGIGTKNTKRNTYIKIYGRAFGKAKRNVLWKRTVNKCGYRVEILLESDDYFFTLKKEIEFIKLYGRINNHTGCLVNMTDGGEGTVGVIYSEDYKKRKSEERKGIKRDPRLVEMTAAARRKKSYQYSLNGDFIKEWNSCREASLSLNANEDNINMCLREKSKSAFGYQWSYIYKGDKINPIIWNSSNTRVKEMKKLL